MAGHRVLDPSGSCPVFEQYRYKWGPYTHTKDDSGAGKVPIFLSLTRDASRMQDNVWLFPDPWIESGHIPQIFGHSYLNATNKAAGRCVEVDIEPRVVGFLCRALPIHR